MREKNPPGGYSLVLALRGCAAGQGIGFWPLCPKQGKSNFMRLCPKQGLNLALTGYGFTVFRNPSSEIRLPVSKTLKLCKTRECTLRHLF